MDNSERVRFINTLLQRGVRRHVGNGTASAVLSCRLQTTEAVSASSSASINPAEAGVNEEGSSVTKKTSVKCSSQDRLSRIGGLFPVTQRRRRRAGGMRPHTGGRNPLL
jgi:hypothetical protein